MSRPTNRSTTASGTSRGAAHCDLAPTRARALAPRWMTVPAVIALVFLLVPFLGILAGADWSDFPALISSEASLDALRLSAITTLTSTVLSAVFGIPLAYWIAAGADAGASALRQTGAKVARTLVSLPIVLPPVVAGLALLLVFGKRGLIGQFLAVAGIRIGFTTVAVIIAQVFVAMPYLVVSLEGALRTRGFELERTALSLGASRTRVVRTVTLPLSAPAIASGLALTFSRSLGEFGATLTFAGSLQGTTRTLPLAIYLARESDTAAALSMAIVLIVVATLVVGGSVFATNRWQARLFPTDPPPIDEVGDGLPEAGTAAGWPRPFGDGSGERTPASRGPQICLDAEVATRGVHLTATMRPGVVTAVVGPNGAGKSTLIGMVAGSIPPSSGAVTVEAEAPTIALLSQRAQLFPHMSVLDNAAYGLQAHNVPAREARIRALTELASLGVDHLAARNATRLSGGQAQRVAIARAMALDPDVVLLDEPMAALDVPVAQMLRLQLAHRLAEAGPTVLLATHDAQDVAALAADAVVLHEGRIVRSGSCADILDAPDESDEFLLRLTGRQAVTLPGSARRVVRPTDLQLLEPGAVGIPVVVEGRTWQAWGPALVARTADGQPVTVPMPEGDTPEPGPGQAAVVALRQKSL